MASVPSFSFSSLVVAPLAPLACALALVACSGAGNDDLFAGSAEANDISTNDPSPAAHPGTNPTVAPPPSPSPAPGTGAPDAGTVSPPVPTPPSCTQEVEPNNDFAKATPFKASFCGKIDSAADVDYASFVVPVGAKTIDVKHAEKNGKAVYRYFLGGASLGSDPSALEAIPGATYTVQIRLDKSGSATALPTYELDVTFQ